MRCKWVVREGTQDTYWAYTPCKPGFNYLSKVHKAVDIPEAYEGRLCPICGKIIHLNIDLLNTETKESEE